MDKSFELKDPHNSKSKRFNIAPERISVAKKAQRMGRRASDRQSDFHIEDMQSSLPIPRHKTAIAIAVALGFSLLAHFALVVPSIAPMILLTLGMVGSFVTYRFFCRQAERNEQLYSQQQKVWQRIEALQDQNWEKTESDTHYRLLMEAHGDIVVSHAMDGSVVSVNDNFNELFGEAVSAIKGTQFKIESLATQEDENSTSDETQTFCLKTRQGKRWYKFTKIQTREGSHGALTTHMVGRDITAFKKSAADLHIARENADIANSAKSRFLATMSHEIRTPLNGVMGMVALLRETKQTPEQQTYTDALKQSGDALLNLINDILDYSKIEAGRLELEPKPTKLAPLLEEIAELMTGRAHEKGIEIIADTDLALPEEVNIDAARLRQIILNLTSNAVKFTDKGGVLIEAKLGRKTKNKDESLRISVTDTGIGINRSDQARIFQDFEQAGTNLSQKAGGTGLGLAISQQLTSLMLGTLDVKSTAGKGACFTLSIPLDAASSEIKKRATRKTPKSECLLITPKGPESTVLARRVNKWGGTLTSAHTLPTALKKAAAASAANVSFGAVMVDSRLIGGKDKAAETVKLMEDAGIKRSAMVILLSPADRADLATYKKAGFRSYLVRPIRATSLTTILDDVTNTKTKTAFLKDPKDQTSRPSFKRSGAPTTHRALLAEDNEINALLARAVLEKNGCDVTLVENGKDAVAAATKAKAKFDMIFMDINMPIMDGLTAIQKIRASEKRRKKPPVQIIALTADATDQALQKAYEAGADDVQTKPLNLDKLREKLLSLSSAA